MCSGRDGKLWHLSDLNIMEMTILVLHVEDIPAKYDREAIQQRQSHWNSTPSVQSISVLPIYIYLPIYVLIQLYTKLSLANMWAVGVSKGIPQLNIVPESITIP